MRQSPVSWGFAIASLAQLATAQVVATISVPYSDDRLVSLTDFSALPPCVATGLHDANSRSCYDSDESSVDSSCVCSTTSYDDFVSFLTSNVAYFCSTQDDAYAASATQVLDLYCDFADAPDFATTFAEEASHAPHEIEEIMYLAFCAYSGMSDAYSDNGGWTSLCPEATGLKHECMCSRGAVRSTVKYLASSSANLACADADEGASASEFVDAYCERVLNGSDVGFPTPTGPPGDMTYYIDVMPQYKELDACAQNGLTSAFQNKAYDYCPDGVQALASCACLKGIIPASILNAMSSLVKSSCSDDMASVTQASEVFEDYCSAAKGEETASGITHSVSEEFPLARPTGVITQPPDTGTAVPCNEDDDQDKCGGGGGGGNKTGVIAGSVVGGVVFLGLIIGIAWFLRRRGRQEPEQEVTTHDGYTHPNTAHKSWHSAGGTLPPYEERPVSELASPDQRPISELASHGELPVSELPSVTQSPPPGELYSGSEELGWQQHYHQQQEQPLQARQY